MRTKTPATRQEIDLPIPQKSYEKAIPGPDATSEPGSRRYRSNQEPIQFQSEQTAVAGELSPNQNLPEPATVPVAAGSGS